MTRSEEELRVGTTAARDGPGPPAEVRRHRGRQEDGPGPAARRSASSASRSPRPTATRRPRARRSPRRSTRSHCTPRSGRREARGPQGARAHRQGDRRRTSARCPRTVRKEQIEVRRSRAQPQAQPKPVARPYPCGGGPREHRHGPPPLPRLAGTRTRGAQPGRGHRFESDRGLPSVPPRAGVRHDHAGVERAAPRSAAGDHARRVP